jgi:hypothetical protein
LLEALGAVDGLQAVELGADDRMAVGLSPRVDPDGLLIADVAGHGRDGVGADVTDRAVLAELGADRADDDVRPDQPARGGGSGGDERAGGIEERGAEQGQCPERRAQLWVEPELAGELGSEHEFAGQREVVAALEPRIA